MGVTSIHTHPSESEDVSRGLRFGRNEKRSLSRGLLDGELGGVGADEVSPPMGLGNRLRRPSLTVKAPLDEDTLADENREREDGEVGGFGITFRGVDGVELVPVVAVVPSPSNGRRLRSRRRRRGRNGQEPAGEMHSLG